MWQYILTPPTLVINTPFYAKSAGHVTRSYQGISLQEQIPWVRGWMVGRNIPFNRGRDAVWEQILKMHVAPFSGKITIC